MEQNVIFKSEFVKNIIGMENISLEEIKNSYFTIIINGKDENFTDEKYNEIIEDFNNICSIISENSISGLEINNIDLSGKKELYNILNKFSEHCDYIKFDDVKCNNVEELFKQIFHKEFQTSENLGKETEIYRFEYSKITKNLTINSGSLKYLNDYKQYVNVKNLFIEISEEIGKEDIVTNIEILRGHSDGTIFLKDVTSDKTITGLLKYENYANRKIVLFKSKLIKKSMGFDRLPTDGSYGITYNLRVDGHAMVENGEYILKEDELVTFLNDLEEISKYCPLNGININYLNIQNNVDYSIFSKIFERVNRINIENSLIPNLKEIINGIEDKSKIEIINIKESGLDLEDIDAVQFLNIKRLSVERKKAPEEEKIKNIEKIAQVNNENEIIEIKLPWYKRLWKKVKLAVFGSGLKALPGNTEK